jgi:predicted house-cleaning noncanonical NTP pyrophosphatase (MazG superfamily)
MKLIRDKYTGIIPAEQLTTVVSKEQHINLLGLKFYEELQELQEDNWGKVEEYADLLQVLLDMAYLNGITEYEINEARLQKLKEKGSFRNGAILKSQ